MSSNVNGPSPIEPHVPVPVAKPKVKAPKKETKESATFQVAISKEKRVATRLAKKEVAVRKGNSSQASRLGESVLETRKRVPEAVPEVVALTKHNTSIKNGGKGTLTLKNMIDLRERLASKIEKNYDSFPKEFMDKLMEYLLSYEILVHNNVLIPEKFDEYMDDIKFEEYMHDVNRESLGDVNANKGLGTIDLNTSMKKQLRRYPVNEGIKKMTNMRKTDLFYISEKKTLMLAFDKMLSIIHDSIDKRQKKIEEGVEKSDSYEPYLLVRTREEGPNMVITFEGNGVPFGSGTGGLMTDYVLDHIVKNLYRGDYSLDNVKDKQGNVTDRQQVTLVIPKGRLPKPFLTDADKDLLKHEDRIRRGVATKEDKVAIDKAILQEHGSRLATESGMKRIRLDKKNPKEPV